MKFLYATDLHGDRRAYDALVELAREEDPDVVLLGGDLCAYEREAAPQLDFLERVFASVLQRLTAMEIPLYLIHGNVDRMATVQRLRCLDQQGLLHLLGLQPHVLPAVSSHREPLHAVGYPYVPPTSFRIKEHERRDLAPDRVDTEEVVLVSSADPVGAPTEASAGYLNRLPSIEEDLARVRPVAGSTILLTHSPPFGILDRSTTGVRAGSRAVLAWIQTQQPLLALHGHIHEAPDLELAWARYVGSTICVNPGAAEGGDLRAVIADTVALPDSLYHSVYGWFR